MIYKKLSVLFIACLVVALLFNASCRKDRSMEAVITVRLMTDTNIVIPGIRVEMTKSDVKIVGYTDGKGQFRQTFMQPIQLDVEAFNDTLSGFGVITLQDYGHDYTQTIFVY